MALKLPKEASWYFLSDRPEMGVDDPPPWILLINPDHSLKKSGSNGNNSLTPRRDKKSYIISGEVLIKLQFIHRLLRARSQNALQKKAPVMYSTVGPSNDIAEHNKANNRMSRAVSNAVGGLFGGKDGASAASPTLSSTPPSNNNNEPPSPPLSPVPVSPSVLPNEKPSEMEAIIIEEALKEKQQLARVKLEKQKTLLKDMSLRLVNRERSEGAIAVRDEKLNLEEITQHLQEMEDALRLSADVDEKPSPERKLDKRNLLKDLRRENSPRPSRLRVSYNELPRLDMDEADLLNRSLTYLEDLPTSNTSSPLIRTAQAHAQAHAHAQAQAAALAQAQADEIATLTARVSVLEVEVEHERKVSEVLRANNSLLEKEVKRLEGEIDREKWEKDRFEREEKWRARLLEIEKLFLQQQLSKAQKETEEEDKHELTPAGSFEDSYKGPVDERERQLNDRVKLAQSLLNDVETDIRSTKLLKQQLHTEMMESKLKKRQQLLKKMQDQHKSMESKISSQGEVEEELDGYESESEEETDPDENKASSSKDTPNRRKRKSQAQLDMLVGKLEKLDKLDELLRKIDSFKVGAPSLGSSGEASTPMSMGEVKTATLSMKAELEELQKIIVDDSGKYTEKERADANIKYEKTFQIYQMTEEYRKDLAAILNERRQRNEPLNKAALASVLEIYSPENLKSNPDLKMKLVKAPELNLIFMDPKAILAKHQNDFQMYQLNKLDVDEMRAIRACLPKFRNDQVKQNEWVETLEVKIEIYSTNPPPKKDMVKKAASKFKKPKATKQSSPGDFLVELLQKFKNKPEEDDSSKRGSRRNTMSFRSPIRLRSFSKSDPAD